MDFEIKQGLIEDASVVKMTETEYLDDIITNAEKVLQRIENNLKEGQTDLNILKEIRKTVQEV